MATYTAGKGKTGTTAKRETLHLKKKKPAAYRGGMIDSATKNLRKSRKRGMDY